MPIYEYKCESCGKELEIEQKINDPAPLCSHREELKAGQVYCDVYFPPTPMKKQISKSSFSLKGGTWARDNYSRKK